MMYLYLLLRYLCSLDQSLWLSGSTFFPLFYSTKHNISDFAEWRPIVLLFLQVSVPQTEVPVSETASLQSMLLTPDDEQGITYKLGSVSHYTTVKLLDCSRFHTLNVLVPTGYVQMTLPTL